ncbi:superoxide dismutase [Idiomarina loihiensis]|jgi:Fe-Mn family superoxide dismutase|uniref:Superoxide dismutase n=1 Tax=Idiomarina loihiensis (strain ATCC BAA-735 / DSM 15497 / L2-TR) TaxID=283942 RepID=Q5R118_IDILO|nr:MULTISPECIES: superoxide dismutase [Idiomarina]AAV81638.1 Superoxide dismutase, Mn dependent [Idiomarina loihiensis L2TR]AGM35665.1 superoxide dismutase, Mn dependent [Idiomarina loihiensis GSL 199]MRJ43742.1 superoxide dismutase [Mn] [Idiomarina loihiensis]UTW34122.1 superoxide dismutase [Idiomarina loihiensis]
MCFKLPALPYNYDALEPHVDAMTMEIHHQRHHQTYVNGLNQALAETRYEKWDLSELLRQIESIPSNMQSAVRNHGGGHANHSLFWQVMSPQGGGEPTGNLAKAIETDIGGFKAFQEQFTQAAVSRFGSGWAWLVINANGQLEITSTANQDSPLMDGLTPILELDVWEHAYYLKYQNKRADYIAAFYEVIHWPEVARRFEEHE